MSSIKQSFLDPQGDIKQRNNYYVSIDIGVKNFAYAMFKNGFEIVDFNIIELSKDNIINDLIEWFKKLKNFLGSEDFIKCVIIEQQVKNNVKALIIQNIIMTICTFKDIDYYVFNPKLKFKLMNEVVKLNYKGRKQKSIDYILMYLNKYNLIDLKLKFMRFIKKDDVADALNMGLMYLNGLEPKKIIEFYTFHS